MHSSLRFFLGLVFLCSVLSISTYAQKRIPIMGDRPNAPPPKPRVGKGNLAISTTPSEAEVFIDGKSVGATDKNGSMVLEFPPGPAHKVEVKLEDHESFSKLYKPIPDKTESMVARLVPKFANLVLAGVPEKAVILLDGNPPPLERMLVEGKQITFNHLATGQHKVRIEHPDWLPWEDTVEVKPDDPNGNVVTPPLILAIVKVTIESNVGATVYVDDADRGTITPEGKLVIPNVRPGGRTLRIVKDDYEEWKHTETLAVGEKSFKVDLVPIPSSAEFNDRFDAGLGKWDAPSNWTLNKGLVVRGEGQGLPKGKNYRDFDVDLDFQLLNGKGVIWVLRARNNNAYVFYLSGPNGKYPGKFRTYLCRNGQIDTENPVGSDPILCDLKPGIFFHLHIEARGNQISQIITPSSGPDAGKEFNIGFFEDPQNSFRLGNIGFRTLFGEEFQVNAFFIKPQDKK